MRPRRLPCGSCFRFAAACRIWLPECAGPEAMAAILSASPMSHAAPPALTDPQGLFRRNYNRKTFSFPHGLASSPLFDLDNLLGLAKRMADHPDTYWSNGKVAIGNSWEAGTGGRMS